ncbi:MAG: nucleotidyltransferase family protein [Magnetococcales bacterium]|nr:nucleotidyltransferase family protein [Magnetococcales bacterium]
MMRDFPEEAIILAGGMGQRLRSVVPDRPKPMALVAGKPFLEHLLIAVARQGVRRVVLSVGYKREAIMTHFGDRFQGVELAYAVEEQPLGTAGGIRLGLERVRGERAFVLNGDTLFDAPLNHLVAAFDRHRADLVMAVKPMEDCSRYGTVRVEGERVVGFDGSRKSGPGVINGGVYLFSAGLATELQHCFSFEGDFLQPNLDRLQVIRVEEPGFFIDIGVPEAYAAAQTLLASCDKE